MAIEVRKIVAALTGGLFPGAVFCAVTIGTRHFLEKDYRIESGQTKTILLIGLVLVAPLLVIITRWSDRINRKWLIPGGVLLAVFAWAVLFRQLPAIAGTAGRIELTDQKEIRSTVAFIGKSRDLTRTTSTFTHFADGMQAVEIKEDTVLADGRVIVNPRTTFSNTLNNSDYWKMVGIFFVMVLSVALIGGPVAKLLYTRISGLAIPPKDRTFAHVN